MPDTYSSGSYSISSFIEPQYMPPAFEPEFTSDTNFTEPAVNETEVAPSPTDPAPVVNETTTPSFFEPVVNITTNGTESETTNIT